MINESTVLSNEIKHLRELLTEQKKSTEKALELQAKEYERRLEILNHEAARLSQMKNDFVPKGEHDIEKMNVEKRVHALELFRSNIEGRMYAVMLVFGIVVTLINLWINLK